MTPPMRSKADKVALKAGDAIHIETPGGGGFGDPQERARVDVASDLVQGLISEVTASSRYGYTP